MKISPTDIPTIRARRAAGEKLLAIALDYDVTPGRVSHLTRDIVLPEPRAGVRRRAR